MKTIVALFLACLATALFGQAPPIQRNPFTTNTAPAAQAAVTNIARAVAGTNRIQILSPAAGNNGYTDGDTIAPVAPFTVGISYYGNGVPFIHFSASTNVGDWHHRVIFSDGIEQIGGPDYMDTNSGGAVYWYQNGSSNFGWKAIGDAFPTTFNMSTNSSSSGSGWGIGTVSSSNGQIPSVIGTVDAAFVLTKTNANPAIVPGWAELVFNTTTGGGLITNHIRGLAVMSPNMTPGGFTAGNYSLAMFDTINKMFRVPYWVSGVFQPQDNPATWLDTLKVDPVNGRVGVGILPIAAPDSTFQVSANNLTGFRLGYNNTSVGYLDSDEFHIRDVTVSASDMFSWSIANGRSGRFVGSAWTNNAHLVVNSNLFTFGTSTSLVNQAKFYSPLAATASRVLFKGADGLLTNVTSASASTDYVHADGTVGSPTGSGIPILSGTGTNTSFSYFTGKTNSPLIILDTNGVPLLWAWTNSSGVARWYLGSNFFNAGFVSYDPSAARLSLASSNGVRAINLVPNSGVTTYVGIGTLEPASDLDIGGGTLSGQTAQFTNYANPINIGVGSQGGIYFSNVATGLHIKGMAFSGTELFAHTNGNVGFGTNAPAGTLSVQGTFYANNIGTSATPVSVLGRASDGKISEMAVPLGSTQAVVIAAGNGTVTNQVTYLPRLMDGRTNSFQIDLSIGRRWVVTNATGLSTNVTFQLTNVADGNEYSIEFDGNSLGTNFTVNVTLAAGGATTTNIDWQSPTNGNFTLTATTNQAYKITGEVAATPTATNIVSRWATTDPNPIRGMVATVSAGQSPSNAVVGGLLYKTVALTAATNLNSTIATFSNALQYIVSGNTMTNTGDSITVIYQGTMKPGTNAFKWFVGYETPFSFTCTNGFTAWELRGEITRTASVGAQLQASFTFLQTNGSTPFTLSGLMTNMFLNYTNGAAVTNVLQLASSQVGSISNNVMKVIYEPATR